MSSRTQNLNVIASPARWSDQGSRSGIALSLSTSLLLMNAPRPVIARRIRSAGPTWQSTITRRLRLPAFVDGRVSRPGGSLAMTESRS